MEKNNFAEGEGSETVTERERHALVVYELHFSIVTDDVPDDDDDDEDVTADLAKNDEEFDSFESEDEKD